MVTVIGLVVHKSELPNECVGEATGGFLCFLTNQIPALLPSVVPPSGEEQKRGRRGRGVLNIGGGGTQLMGVLITFIDSVVTV